MRNGLGHGRFLTLPVLRRGVLPDSIQHLFYPIRLSSASGFGLLAYSSSSV